MVSPGRSLAGRTTTAAAAAAAAGRPSRRAPRSSPAAHSAHSAHSSARGNKKARRTFSATSAASTLLRLLVPLLVTALLVGRRRLSRLSSLSPTYPETLRRSSKTNAALLRKVRLGAVPAPPRPPPEAGARDLSSVDYHACCGLGHRLARTADARLVSRRLRLPLRVFWGYCAAGGGGPAAAPGRDARGGFVEVFDYLFGPQPRREQRELLEYHRSLANSSVSAAAATSLSVSSSPSAFVEPPRWSRNYSFGHYLRLNNHVLHFKALRREGPPLGAPPMPPGAPSGEPPPGPCPCTEEKRDSDARFYSGLRERFRLRSRVDEFRREHFGQDDGDDGAASRAGRGGPGPPFVLGVHVRTGNGEGGDFEKKGRTVKDLDAWLGSLARLLAAKRPKTSGDAVVFVATDTARVVAKLRALLEHPPGNSSRPSAARVTVVSLKQARPAEGSGVLFGQQSGVGNAPVKSCEDGWASAVSDMILLSHADVVVATRPSSFTQTMPLSLVFAPQASRAGAAPKEFCEVRARAKGMTCYRSYMDWCCNGSTRDSPSKSYYEFISMPRTNASTPEMYGGFRPRAAAAGDPGAGEAVSLPNGGSLLLDEEDGRVCQPRGPGRRQVCIPYDWSEFYGTDMPPPA